MSTTNLLEPIAELTLPDHTALTKRAQAALDFIESFVVADDDTYALAADELKAIKAKAAQIEDQRTSITGPINQALRAINRLFAGPAELLERAEASLKGKMLAYYNEQQRLAEETRKVAEEAAAAERRRLADEAAAAERIAAEQRAAAAAAEAAGNATAAAVAKAAADRAQAQANTAAATSQMVIAAPPAEPAKVKGISTASRIDFEVVDLHALVKHIAEHPDLLPLVAPDSVRLRAYVRGLGAAANLPGVRIVGGRVLCARVAA